MEPAIVIAAYDRSHTLLRLLKSIARAEYNSSPKLIISIDKNSNRKVYKHADEFNWKYGEKIVIKHKKHLGLKKHILECGRLTSIYKSIILLEDDLFVSPLYYLYSKKALEYYDNQKEIAGVSIYAQQFNETARMGFDPLDDGSDIFYLQIASSWGQCWTEEQWKGFDCWNKKYGETKIKESDKVPYNVAIWPESSWKKIFIRYLIDRNKYFVYPRRSFTTNFHDLGTHHKIKKTLLQVPLEMFNKNWRFNNIKDSIAVYDAFYEIIPDKLNALTGVFKDFDYTVDFYGQKKINQLDTKYLLRPGDCKNAIKSYGRELKPIELNILYGIEGQDIHFGAVEDFQVQVENKNVDNISYYYSIPVEYIEEKRDTQIEPLKIKNEELKYIEPDNISNLGKAIRYSHQLLRKSYCLLKKMKQILILNKTN